MGKFFRLMLGLASDEKLDKIEYKVNWLMECEEVRRHNERAKQEAREGYKVSYQLAPPKPLFLDEPKDDWTNY